VNLGEHRGDGIRHSMHLSAPNGGLAQMLRDPDGQWVPYSDYAALKAENERLADEVGLMNQLFEKHLTPEIRKAIVNAAKGVQP